MDGAKLTRHALGVVAQERGAAAAGRCAVIGPRGSRDWFDGHPERVLLWVAAAACLAAAIGFLVLWAIYR